MTVFAAYIVERFPLRVFAPAIAFHALAAWWAAAAPAAALIIATALTTLLFVQFRLWDDLEDVGHDRLVHPRRVLVTADRGRFKYLLALLLVVTAAWFAQRVGSAVPFVSLAAVLLAGYRLRPRLPDSVWRFCVLLVKYPAFIVLVAGAIGGAAPARLALAALSSYVAACGYEAWHNVAQGGPDHLRQGYGGPP